MPAFTAADDLKTTQQRTYNHPHILTSLSTTQDASLNTLQPTNTAHLLLLPSQLLHCLLAPYRIISQPLLLPPTIQTTTTLHLDLFRRPTPTTTSTIRLSLPTAITSHLEPATTHAFPEGTRGGYTSAK